MIDTVTLSAAKEKLLKIDTGVERRLLYLGAGEDLGCSLGLFWDKCDSFYLVDPLYKVTRETGYSRMITKLAEGSVTYLEGIRITASPAEIGQWANYFAMPGRRYQVEWEGAPGLFKRLCFVEAGDGAWLTSTNCHYNVVLNKDWAGSGVPQDFPYETVWGRLNRHGIYAETLAPARASAETDFGAYRFRGFEPLYKVTENSGNQIGNNDGLHFFQKTIDADTAYYEAKKKELGSPFEDLYERLRVDFLIAGDYGPDAVKGKPGYDGLLKLMSGLTPPRDKWVFLIAMPEFAEWLVSQLPPQYAKINPRFLLDRLSGLGMENWGPFESI
ncbi:hypothetical protein [Andreprevotia chitinilytica]|uniref:hypothetical protein n=1 Tax=Andreprevotia chitinilytica TaxID=396808 RepID=UPI00147071A6|nr:hypothetical protein [Andreprevotia chitinilytica]